LGLFINVPPSKRSSDENAEGTAMNIDFSADQVKATHDIANRRISVEWWNAHLQRWSLACKIHHDQNYIASYIIWSISFLCVNIYPLRPVGGDIDNSDLLDMVGEANDMEEFFQRMEDVKGEQEASRYENEDDGGGDQETWRDSGGL